MDRDLQSYEPIMGQSSSAKKIGEVTFENLNHSKTNSIYEWPKILILLFITSFILTICLISISCLYEGREQICLSQECIRSASNFLLSMDKSIDPCENFYEFVCGNWPKHIIHGHMPQTTLFSQLTHLMEFRVMEYLSGNFEENERNVVSEAKKMYQACNDYVSMERFGIQTLKKLMNDIGIGFLPPLEGEVKQPIMETLINTKININLNIFLTYINNIGINGSEHNILSPIKRSSLDSFVGSREYYEWKFANETLKNKLTDIASFINYFFIVENKRPIKFKTRIDKMANKIIHMWFNFEVKLPWLEETNKMKITYKKMKLSNLQHIVDEVTAEKKSKIYFKDYLGTMVEKICDHDASEMCEGFPSNFTDETVNVFDLLYFTELSKYMDSLTEKDIEIWIWWKIMITLAPHVNKRLGDLKNAVESNNFRKKNSRPNVCTKLVYGLLDKVDYYQVLKQPNAETDIEKVTVMVDNIKHSLGNIIDTSSWIDKVTKRKVLEKLSDMKQQIAYPDGSAVDSNDISEENVDYEFNGRKHLANLLAILKDKALHEIFEFLGFPYEMMNSRDITANAHFNNYKNSIAIPYSILQFPIFNLGLDALNYGSMGAIIGHEIAHGFDSEGRHFDNKGRQNLWWANVSSIEYDKRLQCYIDEFNEFNVSQINMRVNGHLTLKENVADMNGILGAFSAYQNNVYEGEKKLKLPGLENYSNDQIFFMGFGMIWCSLYTNDGLVQQLNDIHPPGYIRAIMTLRHFDEFAKSWNCNKSTYMNPDKKCKLWVD